MARTPRGQFAPGTSGNPAGRPNPEQPTLDGWTSALTGLGTASRDKRKSYTFEGALLAYEEIARLWERDALAAKAIEAPAAEAFREGYEFSIGDESKYDDLKEQIEDRFEGLGVDEAIETAWQYKRAYGGGAILLGTEDNKPLHDKLDISKVHSLDYLTVFEPCELVPEIFYRDLKHKGKPEYYRINHTPIGNIYGGPHANKVKKYVPQSNVLIHESRLIVFEGIKTSHYLQLGNTISQYWGSSIVNRFIDELRDCGVGYEGAGLLATDVGQPVITIEGLREMIAKHEDKFRARMAALELSRSTARAIVISDKEKFERQTTNLTGIPDILDRLSIRLSASIDIPLSVLFGYSPSALGQPGDVEMKIWYNKIRAIQRRQLTPLLKRLARMVMRSLRQRGLPKKFDVKWRELERLNEKDLAETRLNQARTDSMYVKSGVTTPDEIRRSRFVGAYSYETQVKERDKAPGFIAAVPAGVVPGTVPGAGGAAAPKTAQNAHTVTAYARRNPTQPSLGANAKEGGDKAPENRRDGIATYAELELEHQRRMLERARTRGAGAGTIALLEELVALAEAEVADERRVDSDGPGREVAFSDLLIVIESPKGSTREWADTDGTRGSTRMKYDYGYVKGTRGADGDSVDVYIGPSPDAQWVYVVHQQSKASGFVEYDEDKVMLGFDSANHARDAYLRQYDDERFFGGMSVMTLDDFRRKIVERAGDKVAHDAATEEADE